MKQSEHLLYTRSVYCRNHHRMSFNSIESNNSSSNRFSFSSTSTGQSHSTSQDRSRQSSWLSEYRKSCVKLDQNAVFCFCSHLFIQKNILHPLSVFEKRSKWSSFASLWSFHRVTFRVFMSSKTHIQLARQAFFAILCWANTAEWLHHNGKAISATDSIAITLQAPSKKKKRAWEQLLTKWYLKYEERVIKVLTFGWRHRTEPVSWCIQFQLWYRIIGSCCTGPTTGLV